MKLPDDLVQYELECKKIVLIVDDEADYASIGFNKTKKEGLEIRTLAGQIDDIRRKLKISKVFAH